MQFRLKGWLGDHLGRGLPPILTGKLQRRQVHTSPSSTKCVCILVGKHPTNCFLVFFPSSRGSLRGLPIFNTHPKMGVAYGTGDGLETRLGGLGASNLTEGPRPQPVATNDPFSRLEREVKKR